MHHIDPIVDCMLYPFFKPLINIYAIKFSLHSVLNPPNYAKKRPAHPLPKTRRCQLISMENVRTSHALSQEHNFDKQSYFCHLDLCFDVALDLPLSRYFELVPLRHIEQLCCPMLVLDVLAFVLCLEVLCVIILNCQVLLFLLYFGPIFDRLCMFVNISWPRLPRNYRQCTRSPIYWFFSTDNWADEFWFLFRQSSRHFNRAASGTFESHPNHLLAKVAVHLPINRIHTSGGDEEFDRLSLPKFVVDFVRHAVFQRDKSSQIATLLCITKGYGARGLSPRDVNLTEHDYCWQQVNCLSLAILQ